MIYKEIAKIMHGATVSTSGGNGSGRARRPKVYGSINPPPGHSSALSGDLPRNHTVTVDSDEGRYQVKVRGCTGSESS